jgi:hypothetical protein
MNRTVETITRGTVYLGEKPQGADYDARLDFIALDGAGTDRLTIMGYAPLGDGEVLPESHHPRTTFEEVPDPLKMIAWLKRGRVSDFMQIRVLPLHMVRVLNVWLHTHWE